MATIVLSAVGASLGGGFGGAFLGLSGAVIGRAVGATAGRAIDQRLLGGGSRAVETGRIDRLRIQTAGEGAAIPKIWGQMRVPGHVIWASPINEVSKSADVGGKGSPRQAVTEISYRLSIALALCEGRILGVGRVWADGEEISANDLNMRVYRGNETQMPDPAVAAHEGDEAPAYRGLAYVVLEDLALERWGNRMPQLTFEVTSSAQDGSGLSRDVRAIALIPGTGEYSLATRAVTQDLDLGEVRSLNVNTPMGGTDFVASMDTLGRELPKVNSVSLVVSWFGDDLRINRCSLRPKVEQRMVDGAEMPWQAGGIGRDAAQIVRHVNGRPIYGGTPADQAVIEAIRHLADTGRKAVFYPFILMEQVAGNGLPDPNGGEDQPVMPWRGRITTSIGPGRAGSPDGTIDAVEEVRSFFGQARVSDFVRLDDRVSYHGPAEWSYRRFILHYAHLCAAAGSIDAFLIGSEMIGMTQIRGPGRTYPAVVQLRQLAADVRAILGPNVKIGYAADWSEYFGHHLGDGELIFHLDPLWSHDAIDFIGIDNYMPLSDWRDGIDHLDAAFGRVDNPDYLRANVCGGEGYDWFYVDHADRLAQQRTPITDGTYDEAWVWRYKDLAGWWQNLHYNRPNGVRSAEATGWIPGSKPIWFTEYGCAALDKATNQPNKFLDALSSESSLPHFSSGQRDDAIQAAYIEAVSSYWSDPANNPVNKDGVPMIDLDRAHVWCWDARPFPAFPGRPDLWSDGPAWERGHWMNGRAGAVALRSVVADICRDAGIVDVEVSQLGGVVRGYIVGGGDTGRSALQPLMLAYGFDAVERDGTLTFLPRGMSKVHDLGPEHLAISDEVTGLEMVRSVGPETAGRVRLTHVESGVDYGVATVEASLPDSTQDTVANSEFPLSLTRAEGRAIAERWLAEAETARDTARFALPPSLSTLGPGDIVRMRTRETAPRLWRIDRVERAGAITIDAVRVDDGVYRGALRHESNSAIGKFVPPIPVWSTFLDLPLLRGDEEAHAPYLAATATPWPGSVAAYSAIDPEGGFDLNLTLMRRATIGRTESVLHAARSGLIDRGAPLRIRFKGGALQTATNRALLAGANALAIGDGTLANWEVVQFTRAIPVGGGVWELSDRLRGQAGTDGVMPNRWPVGSVVVILDGAPQQVRLSPTARGHERFWRVGPAMRSPDDPSYRSLRTEADGIGFRPYAPCHLRLDGAKVTWIRRTRVDGDSWQGQDVPLGENRELYRLRVLRDSIMIHETESTQPHCVLPDDVLLAASTGGPFEIAVAQVSDSFGPGPFLRREFNGK